MPKKNLPPDAAKMGEFALIARHFTRTAAASAESLVLGVGDDGALIQPTPGHQLAISSDMLVEGRHFFPDADPGSLGHKALAVNLSDLAAMGARPLGFTLAIALPAVDDAWLAAFARGLFALADAHACPLVGGDTTRGPLTLSITVFGEVLPGQALRRSAAQSGDDLWLSGRTGEARLALAQRQGLPWATTASPADLTQARARMDQPTPRLALGQALAGLAHAAIDVSDGLAGDLGHILQASELGADIDWAALPLAPALAALPVEWQRECVLHGGDDYELLFTASPDDRDRVRAAGAASETVVQRIGRLHAAPGLVLIDHHGQRAPLAMRGHDHFAA
ncbi:thiamine-phosphate kinase [Hydrogenophaga sp.]|uniref:thiamine-phosphate kinase n=1 Tax=Hydrogenophaga sp. TaxID=1904254 RepID=UPI0025C69D84|nr:thiamine-phosphate kinase [Hydrogenophaga sp.]